MSNTQIKRLTLGYCSIKVKSQANLTRTLSDALLL